MTNLLGRINNHVIEKPIKTAMIIGAFAGSVICSYYVGKLVWKASEGLGSGQYALTGLGVLLNGVPYGTILGVWGAIPISLITHSYSNIMKEIKPGRWEDKENENNSKPK